MFKKPTRARKKPSGQATGEPSRCQALASNSNESLAVNSKGAQAFSSNGALVTNSKEGPSEQFYWGLSNPF